MFRGRAPGSRALPSSRDPWWVLAIGASLLVAGCTPVPPSGSPTDTAGATIRPSVVATLPSAAAGATSPLPTASGELHVQVARSRLGLPTALSRLVAVTLGDAILVCGGLLSDGTTTGSIVRIDLAQRTTTRIGRLASPVHDAGGAVLNGAAIIVGGGRTVAGSIVQRVDAAGVTATSGDLPAARADLAAVAIDGELLVVGGGRPGRPDDRVLATHDGTTFRTIATLRVAVRYAAVAVLGDLVYVIGGTTTAGDTDAIQEIDPHAGQVRIVGHLPVALSHAAALVLGGTLFVAGGRESGRAQDTLWRIDVSRGVATRGGSLPYAVSDAAPAVVGGTGFLIGGEDRAPLASIVELTMR